MNYFQQPFVYGPSYPLPPQPSFIQYPTFPEQPQDMPPVLPTTPRRTEQSYIENILRLNLGKVATVYMNFENSQWGSKIFKGTLLAAGTDHIILKDLNSEVRYFLLMIYLNYITFEGEIEYEYPFRKKGD